MGEVWAQVVADAARLSAGDGVLIALGLGLLAAGLAALRRARNEAARSDQAGPGVEEPGPAEQAAAGRSADAVADPAGVAAVSVPTRLTLGVILMLAGYHVLAWGLPAAWLPLHVPERWWWALLAGLGALLWVARGLDRLEAGPRGPVGPDSTRHEQGGHEQAGREQAGREQAGRERAPLV